MLITELGQCKNGKDGGRDIGDNFMENDLMVDVLEMQRLVVLFNSNQTNLILEVGKSAWKDCT